MKYKKRINILLTGGTGFIGKNIYEGLKGEYNIFIPRHSELEITDTVAVRKYIIKNKIKVVIHTAVKGGDFVLENILRMFLSIYKNLDLLDKFINFGSGAEYAKTRDLKKVEESELGKFIPKDNYGLGKLICSKLSKDNKKITTILPFGIFGPGEDCQYKFIANSIVKNLLGLPIKIKQDVIFDYLYIKNLIPIIKFFLKNKKVSGDFNISTTKSIKLTEIVDLINKNSKKASKVTIINKNLNFQYTGSNKKLLKTIPPLKITSYKDSINDFYNFFKKNIEILDKDAIVRDDYFKKGQIRK
ncbi:MAG: NAD-dependent epimerase/dehydratase family protein [Patescibacteria group bacterium]|jgi:GDP-L-fucose synthase